MAERSEGVALIVGGYQLENMVTFGEVLTLLALGLGLLRLFASYDALTRKLIYHLYTPDVQLIFYPGSSGREDGGVTTRTPDYYENDKILSIEFSSQDEEFSIPRERLCYSEYTEDDTKFALSIMNSGERTLSIKGEFLTDLRILNPRETLPKPIREADFGNQMEIQEMDLSEPLSVGPKRKFDFEESILEPDMRRGYSWVINDDRVDGDPMGSYEVILRVSLSVDASEFGFGSWNLPSNIGSIEYGPIEKKVVILNSE